MACTLAVVSPSGGGVGIPVRWQSEGGRSTRVERRPSGGTPRREVLLAVGRCGVPVGGGRSDTCHGDELSGRDVYGHVCPDQRRRSRSSRLKSNFGLTSISCISGPTSAAGSARRRRSEARQCRLVIASGRIRGGYCGVRWLQTESYGEGTASLGFSVGVNSLRQQVRTDSAAASNGGGYCGRAGASADDVHSRRRCVIVQCAENSNQEASGALTVEDGENLSAATGQGIESATSPSSSSSSSSGSLIEPFSVTTGSAVGDSGINGSSSSSSTSSGLQNNPINADSHINEEEVQENEDSTSMSSQNAIEGDRRKGVDRTSASEMTAEEEDEDGDSDSSDDEKEEMKPVEVMRELLRAAEEELELLRAHSGALESEAQAVAERAVSLREEAEKMEAEANAATAAAEEAAAGEAEAEERLQELHAQFVVAAEKVREAEADLAQAIREARAWEEEVREKEGAEMGDDVESLATIAAPASEVQGEESYLPTTDKRKANEDVEEEQSQMAAEEDGGGGGGGQEAEEGQSITMAGAIVGKSEVEWPAGKAAEGYRVDGKGDGVDDQAAREDGNETTTTMAEAEQEEEEGEQADDEEVVKVSSAYAVMVERLRLEVLAIEKQVMEAREAARFAALHAQRLREEAESAVARAREAREEELRAEELVGEAMLRAEMAVAQEVEACHRVSDAEIALQKAEKLAAQVESAAATLAAAEAAEKQALELAQAQVGGGGGVQKDAAGEGEVAVAMVDVWFADEEEQAVVADRDNKEEDKAVGEAGGKTAAVDGERVDGVYMVSETAVVEADDMVRGAEGSADAARGPVDGEREGVSSAPLPSPSLPGGDVKFSAEVSGNGGLGEVVDSISADAVPSPKTDTARSLILSSGKAGLAEEKEPKKKEKEKDARKKEKEKEAASGTSLLLSPPSTQTGLLADGVVSTGKDFPSSAVVAAIASAAGAGASPSPVPVLTPATGTTMTPVVYTSPKQKTALVSAKAAREREAVSVAALWEKSRAFVEEHAVKILVAAALLGAASQIGRVDVRQRLPTRTQIGASAAIPMRRVLPIGRSIGCYVKKLTEQANGVVNKFAKVEHSAEETTLYDTLWLLLASVIAVPLFQKLPGGSPVLGYLAGGALIGPHALSIIKNVNETKELAEFGVVFLLFTIGLELSLERLRSMKKFVFGLGTAQVLVTTCMVSLFARFIGGISGPASMVLGAGLALSSTAVVIQVLQERGESTSLYGRATFSVLLLQDLAVVVLLILIPLLSQSSGGGGGLGMAAIGKALGVAAIKGAVAISAIIAGGRLFLRPIYRRMADNKNSEIFAATTLLVVLGTSVLTARAGLSMALGAFLAGLLIAETEFAPQVESDINPYRGLLLGLFFMTVGMSIDPRLLIGEFPKILASISLLILGKTALLLGLGRIFGLSPLAAVRAGLVLAPGGEFAFVAFGDAVTQGIMPKSMSSMLFLVVGLSMAVTPWLAAGGQWLASRFEQQDVRSLQPAAAETDDLQDHIIIAGFGRAGQMVAQLLSERLIPFVALDVRSERVTAGRSMDLPVYFGDAGSREVLHKVGAGRAAAAVITLDTPGANYRTVWALSKHFPNVKTFVRAHDIDHAINLEKAGATAVVPETLEPSLQLAAAVLAQMKLPATEIASAIDEFRASHLAELTEVAEAKGTSLGYGFSRILTKKSSSQQGGDNDAAGASSTKATTSDGAAGSDRKSGSTDKYLEVIPQGSM